MHFLEFRMQMIFILASHENKLCKFLDRSVIVCSCFMNLKVWGLSSKKFTKSCRRKTPTEHLNTSTDLSKKSHNISTKKEKCTYLKLIEARIRMLLILISWFWSWVRPKIHFFFVRELSTNYFRSPSNFPWFNN